MLPEDKEAGGALDCVDGDRVREERLEVALPRHESAQCSRHRVAPAPSAAISDYVWQHTRCTAQSSCRRRVRHDERDQVERCCVGRAEEHNFEEVSGHCHVRRAQHAIAHSQLAICLKSVTKCRTLDFSLNTFIDS